MALGNLAQRFLVAVVAVPLLLLLLYYHRPEPTWLVIFAASILAMREFFGMTLPAEDRKPALVMGALASAAFYWLDPHTIAYAPTSQLLTGVVVAGSTIALVLAVIVPGLYYLFRFRDIPSVAGRYAATVAGIVYAELSASKYGFDHRFTHDDADERDWNRNQSSRKDQE